MSIKVETSVEFVLDAAVKYTSFAGSLAGHIVGITWTVVVGEPPIDITTYFAFGTSTFPPPIGNGITAVIRTPITALPNFPAIYKVQDLAFKPTIHYTDDGVPPTRVAQLHAGGTADVLVMFSALKITSVAQVPEIAAVRPGDLLFVGVSLTNADEISGKTEDSYVTSVTWSIKDGNTDISSYFQYDPPFLPVVKAGGSAESASTTTKESNDLVEQAFTVSPTFPYVNTGKPLRFVPTILYKSGNHLPVKTASFLPDAEINPLTVMVARSDPTISKISVVSGQQIKVGYPSSIATLRVTMDNNLPSGLPSNPVTITGVQWKALRIVNSGPSGQDTVDLTEHVESLTASADRPAQVNGIRTGPFDILGGVNDKLVLSVDSGPFVTVTLPPGSVTTETVAGYINASLGKPVASKDSAGQLLARSIATTGGSINIQAQENSAYGTIGLSTGETQGGSTTNFTPFLVPKDSKAFTFTAQLRVRSTFPPEHIGFPITMIPYVSYRENGFAPDRLAGLEPTAKENAPTITTVFTDVVATGISRLPQYDPVREDETIAFTVTVFNQDAIDQNMTVPVQVVGLGFKFLFLDTGEYLPESIYVVENQNTPKTVPVLFNEDIKADVRFPGIQVLNRTEPALGSAAGSSSENSGVATQSIVGGDTVFIRFAGYNRALRPIPIIKYSTRLSNLVLTPGELLDASLGPSVRNNNLEFRLFANDTSNPPPAKKRPDPKALVYITGTTRTLDGEFQIVRGTTFTVNVDVANRPDRSVPQDETADSWISAEILQIFYVLRFEADNSDITLFFQIDRPASYGMLPPGMTATYQANIKIPDLFPDNMQFKTVKIELGLAYKTWNSNLTENALLDDPVKYNNLAFQVIKSAGAVHPDPDPPKAITPAYLKVDYVRRDNTGVTNFHRQDTFNVVFTIRNALPLKTEINSFPEALRARLAKIGVGKDPQNSPPAKITSVGFEAYTLSLLNTETDVSAHFSLDPQPSSLDVPFGTQVLCRSTVAIATTFPIGEEGNTVYFRPVVKYKGGYIDPETDAVVSETAGPTVNGVSIKVLAGSTPVTPPPSYTPFNQNALHVTSVTRNYSDVLDFGIGSQIQIFVTMKNENVSGTAAAQIRSASLEILNPFDVDQRPLGLDLRLVAGPDRLEPGHTATFQFLMTVALGFSPSSQVVTNFRIKPVFTYHIADTAFIDVPVLGPGETPLLNPPYGKVLAQTTPDLTVKVVTGGVGYNSYGNRVSFQPLSVILPYVYPPDPPYMQYPQPAFGESVNFIVVLDGLRPGAYTARIGVPAITGSETDPDVLAVDIPLARIRLGHFYPIDDTLIDDLRIFPTTFDVQVDTAADENHNNTTFRVV